jgi:endonuclease/exonuclease/phosphatase family metal-dependent hydrolase
MTRGDFGPPETGYAERIDWILVGGPIGVRSAETVLYNDRGRYPSDHYPVAARLEVNY